MGHIITWDDVANRHIEIAKIADAVIVDGAFIQPAERQIEAMLASHFTVPFSSTNLTAADLAIDETYYRMIIGKYPKKAEAMRDSLDMRIGALKSGAMQMMTSSGPTPQTARGSIWSDTSGYAPTYGVGDCIDFVVDSAQLQDEEDDRG